MENMCAEAPVSRYMSEEPVDGGGVAAEVFSAAWRGPMSHGCGGAEVEPTPAEPGPVKSGPVMSAGG